MLAGLVVGHTDLASPAQLCNYGCFGQFELGDAPWLPPASNKGRGKQSGGGLYYMERYTYANLTDALAWPMQ